MKIKKSKYVFFYFRKFPKINLQSLLFEEDIKSTELETQIVAIPALFGQEVIISKKEFDFIVSLNEVEWQEYQDDFDISNLLKYGIIISNDKSNEEYITYRDREHILKTQK